MDFIIDHPCLTTTIVGILAIILSLFDPLFAGYGFILIYLIFGIISYFRFIAVILIGFNIAAMIAAVKNKPATGVIFSLLCSSFGAVIGTLFNPSYECKKAVKVIFCIQMWILIWAYFSFMLVEWGYHSINMLN